MSFAENAPWFRCSFRTPVRIFRIAWILCSHQVISHWISKIFLPNVCESWQLAQQTIDIPYKGICSFDPGQPECHDPESRTAGP